MVSFDFWKTIQLDLMAIRVKDREKMLTFYCDLLGFDLKREENELAILGTIAPESELIWLEETPDAKQATTTKMANFTLNLTNEAEFHSLYDRLKNKKYPIQKKFSGSASKALLLTDPEGNQLTLGFGTHALAELNQVERFEFKNKKSQNKLAPETYLSAVQLNANNSAEQTAFLQEFLGWENTPLKGTNLNIDIRQVAREIDQATDDLGLDFLQFKLKKPVMEQLIHHLTIKQADFFVDQKHSILTIYDVIGVEWWFVAD